MNSVEHGHKPEKKRARTTSESDIDGHWAWIVLIGTVMNAVIANGQLGAVGIYYVIFLREFQKSSSFTAWISAAQSSALCLMGPLTSLLLSKIGARLTIMCGSLLMTVCYCFAHLATSLPYLILIFAVIGASHNLIISGSLAAVSVYFRKGISSATGTMFAGAGLGVIVIGQEVEWAIETYGWRGTMLIQAGLALQICVFAALVLTPPSSKPKSRVVDDVVRLSTISKTVNNNTTLVVGDSDGVTTTTTTVSINKDLSFKDLFPDPMFWIAVFVFLTSQVTVTTILTILKGFMISIGLPDSFKLVMSLLGIGSVIGRLLAGPLTSRVCPPILMFGAGLLYSAVLILFIFFKLHWTIAVISFVYGILQGNIIVTSVVTTGWVFGKTKMAIVRGYVMFFGVITSLSATPLIGLAIDLTGSYDIAFMVSAACAFCVSCCGLLTYATYRRRNQLTGEDSRQGSKTVQMSTYSSHL